MRAAPLLFLLLGACGPSPPPTTRLRLWTLDSADLRAGPLPPAPRPVFAEDFAALSARWTPIAFPGRPETLADAGFAAAVEHADGQSFLRLSGRHGGLALALPVEPGQAYEFRGAVRANELEPVETSFRGADFWIGEASAEAPLAEILSTRKELVVESHVTPSALGKSGWQEERRLLVTGPRTHFLHVVCNLATSETLRSGSVDFSALGLEQLTSERFWLRELERAQAARAEIEPPLADWQRARRVPATLGAEERPSIVLLPGERLRFPLPRLSRPELRLSLGVGPWSRSFVGERAAHATLHVRAARGELLARELELGRPEDARWQALELEFDGNELEFSLEGDAPLVLGAPVVAVRATDEARVSAAPRGPNLILVSIDTLRADHVGAYGDPRAAGATPNLDRLAREGVLCRDASSQAPYTLPAHATLLTGQMPSVHGVVERDRTLSAARSTPLAELLGRAGFVTRAFTSGGFLSHAFGLDRGFEGFSEIDPLRADGSHYARMLEQRHGRARAAALFDEQGFEGVRRWLGARRDERFFLFLHSYVVHDYDAPAEYLECERLGCARPDVPLRTRDEEEARAFTPEQRAHVVHLYDAAVRYADARLGELVAELGALDLLENTLLVVTSDHGEEFFEHGALQHGRTLYQELLAVPLVLRGPGLAPRVIARPVMLADVVPTVLDALGLARDPRLADAPRRQGLDFLGPDWPARAIWSEVDDRFAHQYAQREESGFKTIHGPQGGRLRYPNANEWQQFDLRSDPREARDLAPRAGAPELLERRKTLALTRDALEELGRRLGKAGSGAPDAGTRDELEQLGYGGGEEKQ